jgi:hypothetical protein
VYSKDFFYFVVSLLVPLGYGELDLFPRASVWHVVFGWFCWALPLFFFSHLVWIWLISKQRGIVLRMMVMTIIFILFLSSAATSINGFVGRQRQEERDEIFRSLSPRVYPGLTENVMESVFSVTNGSSRTAINGMLFCGVNQIKGENHGTPVTIGQLSSAAVPNSSELKPGDSRSEPCLMMWSNLVQTARCADIELWMKYTLESQPRIMNQKWFRLVGYQSRGGGFNWYPEPVDSNMDYCDYFRRQTAPPN